MSDIEKPMTRAEFVVGSETVEKTDEVREHQAMLARSGYGIPAHFYQEHPEVAAAKRAMNPVAQNKAANPVAQNKGDAVKFASDEAEKAAEDAGLTDTDFAGVPQSSSRGYTKADVESVIAAKDAK